MKLNNSDSEVLYQSIISYLPRILVQADYKSLKNGKKVSGAILLADISGFTAFSEKLKGLGRKGSEEITRIVNSYFSPFLGIIFKYGGDLINFSGDALNVLFTDDKNLPAKEERAIAASWDMQQIIQNFGEIHTSVGVFKLGLHIGLHCGDFYVAELGEGTMGSKLAMLGKVFNEVYEITDDAEAGEIIISNTFLKTVKKFVTIAAKKTERNVLKNFKKISGDIKLTPIKESPQDLSQLCQNLNYLIHYLPRGVMEKIKVDSEFSGIIGEHRKSAILFLNIWGLNIEKDLKVINRLGSYYQDVQKIVNRYDGTISKIDFCTNGERLMIIFGAPIAHEDDERRSVNTALEILSLSRQYKIPMRIGINSGYIYAGDVGSSRRREYTVMGDEVNLAARLMEYSQENEIIISETVRSKIRGEYELSPLKSISIKGKEGTVNISIVLKGISKEEIKTKWFKESEAIIGRKNEKTLIEELIKEVNQSKGQIISITGEPGIGKSRLAREVFKNCESNNFKIFIGNCESFGKDMSYLPWQNILADYFNFQKAESREVRTKKMTERMMKIDPVLKEWTPIIGENIGLAIEETSFTKSLDAKLRQQRFFDLVLDLLTFEARQQPLLLIIDDLHWSDNASLLLINYFARNIREHRILLCLVFRPIEQELPFTKNEFHKELKLAEFSGEVIGDLIKSLLDVEEAPPTILNFITEKSHGNPLFIEEMIKVLIENGVITIDEGNLKVEEDLSKIVIPDRLESLIMSRIDRLGEEVKNVIQYAAVIGKEFDYETLKAIFLRKEILKDAFQTLTNFDLIISQKDGYEFKHIITQEVAYGSLAFETRKNLHQAIGNFIEEKEQENLEPSFAILAHHFYNGEDWEKAFNYSIEAGDRAKKSYSNLEALAHYDRSLDILNKMEKAGLLPELMKKVMAEIRS